MKNTVEHLCPAPGYPMHVDEIQITPRHYESLREIGHLNRIKKHEYIFQAGAPVRHVYFLLNGRVKLFHSSPLGRQIIKWFCLPGEFFGLSNLMQQQTHDLYAEACIDSEILMVPLADFIQLLGQSTDISMIVINHLSQRLNAASDILLTLTTDCSDTKVVKLLLRLCRHFGVTDEQGTRLQVHLTHQEMADMVGMCRQTMTSTLNKFKKSGYIKTDRQHITLTDREALYNMLDF